jgi:hypothetical protein
VTPARARAATILAVAALATVLPMAAASGARDVTAAATDSAVTVTRTVSRVHLVDGADQVADRRTVRLTVSQTRDLRSQRVAVSWSGAHPTGGVYSDQNAPAARNQEYPFVLMECRGTAATVSPQTCWTQSPTERKVETRNQNALFTPYRLDRYASAADRDPVVGEPAGCTDDAPVQHWVPFVAADGHRYLGGTSGCGSAPPEANAISTLDRPGNTTYGVTRTDGTGSALFSIWSDLDNASLGCSDTVACSLVAIPIEGISCDVAATGLPADDQPAAGQEATDAFSRCSATGRFAPGALSASGSDTLVDQAVTGALWWSASNWRNRIVVPLTFAATASVCDVVSSAPQEQVYGSELMTQATAQWAPALCSGSGDGAGRVKLQHVQTGEPQARNLVLTGGIHAAFVVNGPAGGYPRPTVSAPTAVTGFAVSYTMDDAAGEPYHSLRLDARLLAKLMTESYPTIPQIKSGAYYLAPNPINILHDPEFLALNPQLKGVATDRSPGSAAIILPSSDSDVMYALTSYIAADPEAVAWLDGKPDPWGMVVNRNYQTHAATSAISLPTYSWPLLDSYEPKDYYDAAGGDLNPCLFHNPVPYLPLVAAPVVRLSSITNAIELALPTSQTACQLGPAEPDPTGEKLTSPGRQPQGFRFLIGITPLADAQRYRLDTAALETSRSASAPATPVDATGRTFVTPTAASLKAAADLATPDPSTGVWTIPDAVLRAKAPTAYPGTMIVSTAVATTGLAAPDARQYAALLRYLVGTGQTPGLANGDLPPGYLPITAANGLDALRRYTLSAADAVAAQKGTVPSLTGSASGSPTPGQGGGQSSAAPVTVPTAPAPTTTTPVAAPVLTARSTGLTRLLGVGPAGLLVPGLVALLGGALATAGLGYLRGGRRR